jgi:hypothetical protein
MLLKMGCPIRESTDQCLFAAPRGLSQLTTSFFASWHQGIHRLHTLQRAVHQPARLAGALHTRGVGGPILERASRVDAGGVRHVRYCVVRMGRRLRRLVRMMLPRASVAVGVFSVYKVTTY